MRNARVVVAVLTLVLAACAVRAPSHGSVEEPDLHYHADIALDAREHPDWEVWLPTVDARWPNLILSVAPPLRLGPDTVTGWDIQLNGLGVDDFFYPETPGFHGPGPMQVGAWSYPILPGGLPLTYSGTRFEVKALVTELGVEPGTPTDRDERGCTRVRLSLDLTWRTREESVAAPEPQWFRDCGSARRQGDMNQCFGAQAERARARLDALLRELYPRLSKEQGAGLRKIQRQWIAYRDAHCRWQAAFSEGGSIQPTEYALCVVEQTNARIEALRLDLCEGQGLTGECEASRRYHD